MQTTKFVTKELLTIVQIQYHTIDSTYGEKTKLGQKSPRRLFGDFEYLEQTMEEQCYIMRGSWRGRGLQCRAFRHRCGHQSYCL